MSNRMKPNAMSVMKLGRTGLTVSRTGFGALPIQRCSREDAQSILLHAYENGVTYYDTARYYSDSEEKLGRAFTPDRRRNIVLATKTGALNADDFWTDLHTSLRLLNTDYIDVYQFHNPAFLPRPGGEDGLYDAMLEARRQGKIRFISITNHRLPVAREAVESGLYDTLQFPFSLLAGEQELALVEACRQRDVGFIAMKALSGGLITNAAPTFAYIRRFDNVLPIWGIQRRHELEEFLRLEAEPPAMDEAMNRAIEEDRAALAGDFCRGCGYCAPCPAGIEIHTAARIYYLATRAPYKPFISKDFQAQMARVENCMACGACRTRCPYGLDTPALLKKQYALYREFVEAHADEA